MGKIITVNREFGSGGREFSRLLADELGYAYYDGEVIDMLVREYGKSDEYIKRIFDKQGYPHALEFNNTFVKYAKKKTIPSAGLLDEEEKVIRKVAERGNVIIVGRGANGILQDLNPINIFLYANLEHKIKRCRERRPSVEIEMTSKELEKRIKEIDKYRIKYNSAMTDLKWGAKENFDLCINTSYTEDLREIIRPVAQYLGMAYDVKALYIKDDAIPKYDVEEKI